MPNCPYCQKPLEVTLSAARRPAGAEPVANGLATEGQRRAVYAIAMNRKEKGEIRSIGNWISHLTQGKTDKLDSVSFDDARGIINVYGNKAKYYKKATEGAFVAPEDESQDEETPF